MLHAMLVFPKQCNRVIHLIFQSPSTSPGRQSYTHDLVTPSAVWSIPPTNTGCCLFPLLFRIAPHPPHTFLHLQWPLYSCRSFQFVNRIPRQHQLLVSSLPCSREAHILPHGSRKHRNTTGNRKLWLTTNTVTF